MSGILSLTTFSPLIGVAAILAIRLFGREGQEEAAARAARWIALVTTLVTFVLSIVLVVANFDAAPGRLPVRREPALVRRPALPHGRRRHLGAVRAA